MLKLTRRQVREIDRRAIEDYGMSGLVLMENAGRGLADLLCLLDRRGPVVIACGKGNNAGDGFVLARHLDLRGLECRVLAWSDPAQLGGDALANYRVLARTEVPIEVLAGDDSAGLAQRLADARWIVDALLGTGATGEPRPPFDAVIDGLNAAPAHRLAVDLPSGLDCDTGTAASHTVRADHTGTFVAAKPGLVTPAAAPYVGQLHVLDIGCPRRLIEEVAGESL